MRRRIVSGGGVRILAALTAGSVPARGATLAAGVHLGEPAALTVRVGDEAVLEGMLGWGVDDGGRERLAAVANVLSKGETLFPSSPAKLHPCGGVSVRAWRQSDRTAVRLRVPVGLVCEAFRPIEFGANLAPGMNVVPDTKMSLDWGFEVRCQLK